MYLGCVVQTAVLAAEHRREREGSLYFKAWDDQGTRWAMTIWRDVYGVQGGFHRRRFGKTFILVVAPPRVKINSEL